MTVAAAVRTRLELDRRRRIRAGGLLLVALAALITLELSLNTVGAFPETWRIPLAEWINEARRWVISNQTTHALFLVVLNPISDTIDYSLRWVEAALLWVPWYVVVAATGMLATSILGIKGGLLTGVGVMYFGSVGLWEESVQTLALMGVAVVIAVAIGVPLGIWGARRERVERALRPLLDAMQTLPAFVYLIPVVLLFGIARVPAIIATVIYALPPVIRLTTLGIRSVESSTVEAAEMFGATPGQILRKVQLPQAMPTILTGINQTIMMALSIVVIAALIGAGGLGQVVLESLRRLFVGRALEAGLAIVVLAMIMDRLTHGAAGLGAGKGRLRFFPDRYTGSEWVRRIEAVPEGIDRIIRGIGQAIAYPFAAARRSFSRSGRESAPERHPRRVLGGTILVAALVFGTTREGPEFPSAVAFSFAGPVDSLVDWVGKNLYQIGESWIGTGPFSDFVTIYAVTPLREFFSSTLAWPVVVIAVILAGWWFGGPGLATLGGACAVGLGLLGMWTLSMDTLAQVIVAVILAIALGIPLGVLSSRSNRFERLLKPVLDFLQTIPSFVILVPVIILFNVGRIPGIIASVLYALPAATRLTSLGIRRVSAEATEAARAFGATKSQILRKVQLPLAMPTIIAGINQTVMLVLAMVVIAGLVGGGGLGLETVRGLRRSDSVGSGFAAGLAIVLLAMILDRLLQAWARRISPPSRG
ncbi:MAG: ABC transporter permease subunit [bacterium]|nr:ABC transporter permease subunit [bacterium]MDE0289735.1 ABC transporter permease subunit [bacterium]MDE0439826.1 ABC transporter permease subunit [bacterium]